jgi:hypothetical protein
MLGDERLLQAIEVDLEKGLPKNLNLNNWVHLQPLDYKQLPFKGSKCHEYGHFAKDSQKSQKTPGGRKR